MLGAQCHTGHSRQFAENKTSEILFCKAESDAEIRIYCMRVYAGEVMKMSDCNHRAAALNRDEIE